MAGARGGWSELTDEDQHWYLEAMEWSAYGAVCDKRTRAERNKRYEANGGKEKRVAKRSTKKSTPKPRTVAVSFLASTGYQNGYFVRSR